MAHVMESNLGGGNKIPPKEPKVPAVEEKPLSPWEQAFQNAQNSLKDTFGDNPYLGGGGGDGGSAAGPARSPYEAAKLPSATSQEQYINALYDANAARQRAALEQTYIDSTGIIDRQAAQIPGQYNAAANQVAAADAIKRANFAEQAAAYGLNSGTGGQASLAQNAAYVGNIANVRKAEADAQQDLSMRRAEMEIKYKQAIAQAIAENDRARAAALYDEARRVDESLVTTAVRQADENYRAWAAQFK